MIYASCILFKKDIRIHKDIFLYCFLKVLVFLTFRNLIPLEFIFVLVWLGI